MSKKNSAPKSKELQLVEITRTRRFISVHYRNGEEDFKLRSNDNPRGALLKALDALAPLVCEICETPAAWVQNMWVIGIKVGTMRDARTAQIYAQRAVTLSGSAMDITTPPALLSQPQTEGAVFPPLTAGNAELVATVIECAKDYIKGDRAQGTLNLEDGPEEAPEKAADDPAQTGLPLAAEAPKKSAKKKTRKASAKAKAKADGA